MEEKLMQVVEALRKRGIKADFVPDKESAKKELLERIPAGASVGIGGSITIEQLGVEKALADKGCNVYWHWRASKEETMQTRRAAVAADIYLASSNAITEDGRLVNIDGMGNRLTGMVFGPPRVILVIGSNKLAPNLDAAIDRARNKATVPNVKRLGIKAPCYYTGHCISDCASPSRACKVLMVIERKPTATDIEVILVGEELGY
ncbi:MAG: lactate utilization protein [bacterium]